MLKIKRANKGLHYSTVLWIVLRENGKEKYNLTGNLFAEFTIHTYPHAHTRTHTIHSVSQAVQISSRIISLLVL